MKGGKEIIKIMINVKNYENRDENKKKLHESYKVQQL